MTRVRHIGDMRTWMPDLDTEGIVSSTTPDSVLESTTFKLKPPINWRSVGHLWHYTVAINYYLDCIVFKYRYVTAAKTVKTEFRKGCDYFDRVQDPATRLENRSFIDKFKVH